MKDDTFNPIYLLTKLAELVEDEKEWNAIDRISEKDNREEDQKDKKREKKDLLRFKYQHKKQKNLIKKDINNITRVI